MNAYALFFCVARCVIGPTQPKTCIYCLSILNSLFTYPGLIRQSTIILHLTLMFYNDELLENGALKDMFYQHDF